MPQSDAQIPEDCCSRQPAMARLHRAVEEFHTKQSQLQSAIKQLSRHVKLETIKKACIHKNKTQFTVQQQATSQVYLQSKIHEEH